MKQLNITLIVVGMLFLLILPMASAETAFYVQKDKDYDLKFTCKLQGGICPPTTMCNMSISYLPNSSTVISNQNTSNLLDGFFSYPLNDSQNSVNGEYFSTVLCTDTATGLNDSSDFIYEVNPTGIRPSDQKTTAVSRGIWFLALLGILCFISFFFVANSPPTKWTMFIIGFIFLLISLNLLFVGLQDEVVNPKLETFFDGFTSIAFIFYWGAGGLLMVIWILTTFNTLFFKQNLRDLQKYGGEFAE